MESTISPRRLVKTHHLRLVLLRGSLLGGLLGLTLSGGFTLRALVLHVLIIDIKCLVDLSAEGLFIVKPRNDTLALSYWVMG